MKSWAFWTGCFTTTTFQENSAIRKKWNNFTPQIWLANFFELLLPTLVVFLFWVNTLIYIDRVSYFSYFTITLLSHTTNMATLVNLRQPVTIAVTDFTNPDNLTNDLHILNYRYNTILPHFILISLCFNALLCIKVNRNVGKAPKLK